MIFAFSPYLYYNTLMNQIWFYTITSVIVVSLISLIGIISLSLKKGYVEKIVFYLIALAAGTLLGDAFIHLLPEIVVNNGFDYMVGLYILSGIIIFFLIEKYIHWHHCQRNDCLEHGHPVGTLNLFGDVLHNFIDGAIIAGSFLVSIPLGIATSIAVIMHEIPQEIGDFGVLIHSGFSRIRALWFNFLSALTAVLGAIVILILGTKSQTFALTLTQILIPFTAGGFIYIALSDLVPELHKELKPIQSFVQFLFLILGIALMLLLLRFE